MQKQSDPQLSDFRKPFSALIEPENIFPEKPREPFTSSCLYCVEDEYFPIELFTCR
jgi:hypothetical protein